MKSFTVSRLLDLLKSKIGMPKVPKMPKVKVFCLFKMIGFQYFSSF